jgi:hypothetical protein
VLPDKQYGLGDLLGFFFRLDIVASCREETMSGYCSSRPIKIENMLTGRIDLMG